MMRKRIFLPVMLMIFTIFISCSKKNDIKNAHLKTGKKYTEENLKGKAEVRIYDDTVSMLKAVENKQADAAFEDLPVISYTLNQDPDTQLKVGTEKLTNIDNGFMVKKGSHQE